MTAKTPNNMAAVSNFFEAAALILYSSNAARWQNIAMNARKSTEYSQIDDTTLVHIATMITITMTVIAPQAALVDFLKLIKIFGAYI